jgi:TDG/mug DNA glycosylase family protein
VDRRTAEIYERSGRSWTASRGPQRRAAAQAFARWLDGRLAPGLAVADLGCGPGWYSADLPAPVVALDVARTMLDLVPEHAPSAWRVCADLEALPFRRGSLGAAWASNSYVHLPRASVPLALADLHRALPVGAPVELRLMVGDYEGHDFPGDDLAGRFFSAWSPESAGDLVAGAGFGDVTVRVEAARHGERLVVRAVRARTLPDYVGPAMRLLVVGLNPSIYAADAGVGFARPGNRFWPAARAAGLVSRDRDPRHALVHHGVGMTDLVKRATRSASEINDEEWVDGVARVDRVAAWLQPAVVCFAGMAGWRAAIDRRAGTGPQERRIGDRPVYVMPNPSGANAHARLGDLTDHLRAAVRLGDAR